MTNVKDITMDQMIDICEGFEESDLQEETFQLGNNECMYCVVDESFCHLFGYRVVDALSPAVPLSALSLSFD